MKIFKILHNTFYKKNYISYFWIWDNKTKTNRLILIFSNIKFIFLYKNTYFFPFLRFKFLLISFFSELNIIQNLFSSAEKTLNIWFFLKLHLNGVGYKILYLKNILILMLNFSHIIKFKFLNMNDIYIQIETINNLILKSMNKSMLGIFSSIIKLFRMHNNYNKNGIRNIYEYLKTNKLKIIKK
ncbi:putative ribosomal protein L6 (apicoplast) [Besnoitia besnoiti]|uniref:Putative ribosomal protein L6 n=1 Tax=Besnoitia besnoiti TaxID=94643 RepID=A0A2A9LXR0_BESBE|nr:putative ribosomal protein L6 [Besnoitia besnoiti]PFH30595.1 putative ribosomal protein L6 [Besnoitia besnoiti]